MMAESTGPVALGELLPEAMPATLPRTALPAPAPSPHSAPQPASGQDSEGPREQVVVDGQRLEGGGQILRNAAAYACLTGRPVSVINVRGKRSRPGLRAQHLEGLRLVAAMCKGRLTGGAVGSGEVALLPGVRAGGIFTADTHTAGSIMLLLQVGLPCALFAPAPCTLVLRGGTNAEMAPQVDYAQLVFLPMLQRFGATMALEVVRRGYFPKGGGEVRVKVPPVERLSAVEFTERGSVVRVYARVFVAGRLPLHLGHEMAAACTKALRRTLGPDVALQTDVVKETSAVGSGSGLMVVAETDTGCLLAGSALGKKGRPAADVGRAAADMLAENLAHGGCVDEYLADQIIILMALAEGTSRVRCGPLSLHTLTAMYYAEQFTGVKFGVTKEGPLVNLVECTGCGLGRTAPAMEG